MRILIVDDSRAMRMIVKRTVGQAGYRDSEFVEATNGAEALAAIRSEAPDLVLSDWNMPEMSGIDLLRSLKEAGIEVCFGFVTSETTAEMRATAFENGARFLISKPFTAESFEDVLSWALTDAPRPPEAGTVPA